MRITLLALILALCRTASAEPPVEVRTYGQHVGVEIVYHYEVTNRTADQRVPSLFIGYNYGFDDPNTHANDAPELTVFPSGSYWVPGPTIGDQAGITLLKGGTYTAPQGWTGYPQVHEESDRVSFHFRTSDHNATIVPGQTARFSITVPKADQAYIVGHFTAGLRNGPGEMKPLDTTPPELSLTVSPNTLWPPNKKNALITVAVSTRDDYDPQPEIKLESITANEPIGPEDVVDATIGTDDRSFSLKASRSGTNPAGRVYTITYSATDGTSNKATASTTVTVPHDQGR